MKKLASALFLLLAVAANLFAQVGPTSGGGGSVASGTAIGSCTSSILYTNASTLLGCNPAAVVNGSVSTAGRSILTIQDTISGSSATSNFLNITGTFPATLSAETSGALFAFTGANDNQIQNGLKASIVGANTSLTNLTTAIRGSFSGSANGTAGWFTSAPSNVSTNYALIGQIQGSGSQSAAGVVGWSQNISSNFSNHGGVFSGGGGGANPTRAYGVMGMADSDAASGAMGGYFYLATSSLGPSSSIPTPSGIAGLVADNGSVAANIFEARDNGTAVFTIADGGQMRALAGSATAPGMSFIAETGTGLYQATNRMNAAVAQGDHWSFNASGSVSELQLGNATHFSWSSTDPPTAADGDTGLQRVAAGVVGATSGASLGSPGWVQNSAGEVSLNADYTNATATFSNTALSVTVISGRTYNFSLNLTFADSTAADGAQFDFNGGSAAATNFRVHCMSTNAAGAILAQSNAASTALATANSVTLALTTQANLVCNGTFVPSGNGTFIVRAAQAAHSTGTLTVHRGSWLSVKDARPL